MPISLSEIIIKTRKELQSITGLDASSTVKTVRDEKGWHIFVEMVEKHSIPDGMDILATYEAILDLDGNLTEFRRRGLRKRMDTAVTE
ncbi:MAG TPA: hypothetical protein DDW94_10785 [Deltaproteobacteria bacterium]|nr:MAG: hypothetical protein A2Z79_11590 [Deltaproteobacteria bacterium GWA2_55_82]OGQ63512.1 MAG: hypothetical protein A3I81_05775 [Deltaproteobacteria bacterium RIFCSPLOWO2_02_FULL_55_12]OIJ74893.1 MAG: hypothetical protein A2V21_311835 [Deltaproteobacteria bacterium GWC2_55_46]HBG47455.1 hypothetical protein [Deltaproteobacteria bacterium]HCY11471.1 hypothetical protein [Deltaproteobacteria bacterium]